jgi:HEPN domain-containing protein
MQDEVVKEWIEKAEEDFGFASLGLREMEYLAQVCFHFQQSAEKYLKAFILANQLEFRPVHNLLELLEICKQKEPNIVAIEECCRYLNPFYIDTRYPVHWPSSYTKEAATKARNSAEEIRAWVTGYLGY